MRREEIVEGLGVTDSGNLSRILEDLEHCGFIARTNAYGIKKYNAIYRLMDNFSLFYLKFMHAKKYLQIPYEKCREGARMPEYATLGDSGMDLYALEDYTIHPGETKLIPTGLKFEIPVGYEFQVRPKSGRALKTKLRIANSPGTVDAPFRGEVCVIVDNIEPPIKDITYEFDEKGHPVITSILHGSDYYIGKGEKFAQIVLAEVPKANFYLVDKVNENTERAGGGFGSTGLK